MRIRAAERVWGRLGQLLARGLQYQELSLAELPCVVLGEEGGIPGFQNAVGCVEELLPPACLDRVLERI